VPVRRGRSGARSAPVSAPEEVYSGRILRDGRLVPADVGITDGRIVAVRRQLTGGRRHDLGQQVLLPSALDLHVHFRDPGPPGAGEGFDTGTLQAVHGGVGAVVDMPNTLPPVDSLEHLEEKEGRARGRCQCDVLLYAALVPRADVETLGRRAAGFKLYLSPTTGDLPIPSWEELPALLQRVAATRLPLHVHAEDPRGFGDLASAKDARAWDAARPASSEESALSRLLPGPPSLKLHLAHLTTRKGVELARTHGVSGEVTPQHLLLAAPDSSDARWKVNPPLRREEERSALFTEFAQGRVPMLASDHAPHPLAEKERPFPLAPAGMPGVETALPLLLARVRDLEVPLSTVVQASSERPARFLGLPRGSIAPGQEADLLAVDFRQVRRIRAGELHAPCGWTAFEGLRGIFPTLHLLRGEVLISGGEFVGSPRGRILRPGDLPPRPAVRPLTGLPTEGSADRAWEARGR
jgi:dihydroorotase